MEGVELGEKFKREETYIYLELTHVDVWQKSEQYCKVIILQLRNLKKINRSFNKKIYISLLYILLKSSPHVILKIKDKIKQIKILI